jgi:hypothetical protein
MTGRIQFIEIEDQAWCLKPIRDGATDYLQFVVLKAKPYQAIVESLNAALERAGTNRIIDLCSGAGGPWPILKPGMEAARKRPLEVCLTDLYPNDSAWQQIESQSLGTISYENDPVDALHVPARLKGFRTLFSGFHHFPPEKAAQILGDAVEHQQGIGIFELTDRRLPAVLGMIIVPLIILLVTPAIRPLRLSRLIFTYLLPAIPLIGLFDGIVSCLRTYSPDEMHQLIKPFNQYDWDIGQISVRGLSAPITYTIGTPKNLAVL